MRRPAGNNSQFTYLDGFSLKECLPSPPPSPVADLALGNLVWCDDNNNGIKDVGESGIDGVTVQLVKDQNLDGVISSSEETTLVATTTTAGGGLYQFSALYSGRYRVIIPTSNFGTGQALNLKTRSSTITDSSDNGEDNDDNGIQSSAAAKTYSPDIVLLQNTEPGTGVDGTNAYTDSTVDFGFTSTTCLGGTIWCDDDNDGTIDLGESKVSGAYVVLYQDINCDGDINDAGESVEVSAQVTDSSGNYLFENLLPGCYIVAVPDFNFVTSGGGKGGSGSGSLGGGSLGGDTLGGGGRDGGTSGCSLTTHIYSSTATPGSGSVWGADGSTASQTPGVDHGFQNTGGATTVSSSITVTTGSCVTNIHFGFTATKASVLPDPAAGLVGLADFVFCDENNNGVKDAYEVGIMRVVLELYHDADGNGVISGSEGTTPVATTNTDANGIYYFTDLSPGNYQIKIPTSNFSGTLRYKQLSSTTTSALDNQVDHDDNGIQSGGAGTVVVSPLITLSLPFFDPRTGTTTGGEPPVAVDCTGDRVDSTLDFGFVPTTAIGNLVWCDEDNDGVKDTAEVGIANVTVELLRDGNWDGDFLDSGEATAIATTTTNSLGNYEFTGLLNGNYKVRIPVSNFSSGGALSDRVRSSVPTDSTDNQEDMDDNGAQVGGNGTEVLSPLILLMAGAEPNNAIDGTDESTDSTVDFGFFTPLALGNLVWCDSNKDGVAQSGEPRFKDVLIWLYQDKNEDGVLTAPIETSPLDFTRSDNNGNYEFGNLGKGIYKVQVLAGNMASGQPLELKPYSTVPQVNLDNGSDNDNNGTPNLQGHVDSPFINLAPGSEPNVATDGTDTHADSTIDFGFVDTLCSTITISPSTLPNGTLGTAYSQTLSASGGTAPYTYAVTTGTLPTGLILSSGGAITGTPTSATSRTFIITATDSSGCNGTREFTVAPVCPTIGLSPTTLPNGTVGTAYSQTLSASGGAVPYSYAITTGGLPAGLSLSSGGAITGMPSSVGTGSFTVTVTDANGCTGSLGLSISVNAGACPTVTISPSPLSSGTVGTAYSATPSASPSATYTWTASGLPAGLSINASTGVISGTPTATGTATITATATITGSTCSATTTLTVSCPTITLSPTTLPNGTVNTAYSQTVSASGGTAPYSFAVTTGTLPTGLGLSSGGAITGTPTSTTSRTFTITATDSNGCVGTRVFTVAPVCPVINLSPASLPNGTVGTAYSQTVSASGGIAPYGFAVTTGTLPTGLSLSSGGAITGTPTSTTSRTFTITATDGNGCTGTREFTVAPVCPTITLSPSTLPNGTVGTAYSQSLSASGGAAPYSFAVTAGTLPAGLSLSSGVVNGTPTSTISRTFTITATDANGCTGGIEFTVAPVCPTITLTPTSLPNGTVGTAYSQTLSASGGTSSYTYAVTTGGLPAGLSLSSAGAITGTPTTSGTASFTVTTTDTHGCTGTSNLSITVNAGACPTVTITPTPLAAGTVGTAYSATPSASPAATYTWSATSLPAGLSLNTSTGAITGTPTATGTATITATATITGSTCSASTTLTVICPSISITPLTLPNGTVNTAYSQTLSASGGTSSYSYAVTSGILPAGLNLSSGGAITGTPTSTTSQTFTITVTDANGCTGTHEFTVAPVCPVITMTPSTLPNGTVGTAYSQTLGASGGIAPYSYAVTTGVLPTGLSLGSGVINGTPTSTTSQTFTITVTDANGCTGTREFTVAPVCPVITMTPSTLPNGTVGTAYSQTLGASGGTSPYSFAVTTGVLPTGLSLGSGVINGTPTSATSQTFTITATDANGCTGTREFTVAPVCPVITLTPSTLPNGTVGTAYSQTLGASGGTSSYTYAVTTGGLPAGLSLSSAGAITGTPTTSGTASFTVTTTDTHGCTGTSNLSITVNAGACPTVTITPTPLAAGTVGTAYSATPSASPAATYTWSATSLPAGLSLNTSTGAITGTPTATGTATITATATITGSTCSASTTLTVICPSISITPLTLPNGTVNTAYSQTLSASGGTSSYSYAVTSGILPAGLNLSSGGAITGTPTSTTSQTFTITVTATDAHGCMGSNSLSITIEALSNITGTILEDTDNDNDGDVVIPVVTLTLCTDLNSDGDSNDLEEGPADNPNIEGVQAYRHHHGRELRFHESGRR
ncbi:MAG: putative Ig domain-containing protein [Verrucomicrobiaceae bacterium]|nr:putative Ig domain-containing protein [Verrucomicrobiaceae bacterium]